MAALQSVGVGPWGVIDCVVHACCRVKGGQELVAAIQAAKQARLKVRQQLTAALIRWWSLFATWRCLCHQPQCMHALETAERFVGLYLHLYLHQMSKAPCAGCISWICLGVCWCMQVWENWNPEDDVVPGEEDDDAEASSSSGAGERLPVMVTEVVSGNEFFLQVRTHDAAECLMRTLPGWFCQGLPWVPWCRSQASQDICGMW